MAWYASFQVVLHCFHDLVAWGDAKSSNEQLSPEKLGEFLLVNYPSGFGIGIFGNFFGDLINIINFALRKSTECLEDADGWSSCTPFQWVSEQDPDSCSKQFWQRLLGHGFRGYFLTPELSWLSHQGRAAPQRVPTSSCIFLLWVFHLAILAVPSIHSTSQHPEMVSFKELP